MLFYYFVMYHLINPSINLFYTYIVLYLISIVKYFLEFFLFPFIYLIILILYINPGDKSSDSEKFFVYIIDFIFHQHSTSQELNIFRHQLIPLFFDTIITPGRCRIISKNAVYYSIFSHFSTFHDNLRQRKLGDAKNVVALCRVLAKNLAEKNCIIQFF